MRQGAKLQLARVLRSELTDAERLVWSRLRRRQIGNHRLHRQSTFRPNIVDFVGVESRVATEIDRSQQLESPRDARRDASLRSKGYRVMRFWNDDVLLRMDGVLAATFPLAPSGHLPARAREGN